MRPIGTGFLGEMEIKILFGFLINSLKASIACLVNLSFSCEISLSISLVILLIKLSTSSPFSFAAFFVDV